MNKAIIPIIVIGILIVGILIARENKTASPSQQSVQSNSNPILAVYKGTLPCADCPGIESTITFYTNGTFKEEDIYQERNTEPFITQGKWATHTGTSNDPNAIVYQLNPDKPDETQNYLVTETQITQLDKDMNPIDSPFNMSLKKQ